MTREITITNRDGLPIRGDLHLPDGHGPHPLVLVAHGFKGFREWGSFPHIAESLAGAGLAAFRFDFARNGIGDDPVSLDRLDLFEENSLSREIADLADVLGALDSPEFDGTDRNRLGLLGHSRGGGVAVLFAAREPRVRSLATWAATADFPSFFPPGVLEEWNRTGALSVENKRTGQTLPLGRDLLADLTERAGELDVTAAAARLEIPHLILHGDADESVPLHHGHALHEASGGRARLVVLPGAGHTFGAVHPFPGTTPDLERVLGETSEHFRATL